MFKTDTSSDTVINNMCESFNSKILKFRGKPIISMLKDIRLYLMSRFQQNRHSILRVESEFCLKVYKRLHMEKVGSCREQAEKYTNACYPVSTYKACYEHSIDPLNGANMWTPTGLPLMPPPIKRRPLGRPKKKRALEPNEPKRGHNKGLGIAKRGKSCGKIG
ncbi:hypothetical protein SO802_019379 [Lithocarpus litseifolius]|uniref:Uncharacterized protein n=1 Tax=Lithocarpus litseifolius TaxID=425828 RepID=A0AAW2CQH7_9ROSI